MKSGEKACSAMLSSVWRLYSCDFSPGFSPTERTSPGGSTEKTEGWVGPTLKHFKKGWKEDWAIRTVRFLARKPLEQSLLGCRSNGNGHRTRGQEFLMIWMLESLKLRDTKGRGKWRKTNGKKILRSIKIQGATRSRSRTQETKSKKENWGEMKLQKQKEERTSGREQSTVWALKIEPWVRPLGC